jgi:hypothetical protein
VSDRNSEKETSEDEVLQRVAREVSLRGMEAPAIFFLEMYKPLLGVMQNVSLIGRPVLAMLLGAHSAAALDHVLQSRGNVEKLIALLEQPPDAERNLK